MDVMDVMDVPGAGGWALTLGRFQVEGFRGARQMAIIADKGGFTGLICGRKFDSAERDGRAKMVRPSGF